jgi:carbon storage regulator
MLVLTRRNGEEIRIGNQVTILVVKIGRGKVKIGIQAPKEVPVHRAEIATRVAAELYSDPMMEPIHDRLF